MPRSGAPRARRARRSHGRNVLKQDNYYTLSGKGIDHLGGYLSSHIFNGTCTGDDKWTVPVPQEDETDEVIDDLKELCSEWGWKFAA